MLSENVNLFHNFNIVNFLGIMSSIVVFVTIAIGFAWMFLLLISTAFGAVGIFIPKLLSTYGERSETHADMLKSKWRRLGHRIKKVPQNRKAKRVPKPVP
jgi:hypothetical protein